jgi:hypothetical protein
MFSDKILLFRRAMSEFDRKLKQLRYIPLNITD